MILVLITLTSIILGLGLIATGAYLWLAVKKTMAGILHLVVGSILTLVPISLVALFTITNSVRG